MKERMDQIIDTYIGVWNGESLDKLDEIATQDVRRRAGSFSKTDGLQDLKEHVADHRKAFPDSRLKITKRAYGDDFFFCIWEYEGTNTGPGEFPATGKSAHVTGTTLVHVRDGKMAREDVYFDNLGFLQQLGFEIQEPAAV